MIKLIVNADDFGYSNAVNYGILDAFKYGVVRSTTMMMNMPGTEHAVKLAKENPSLGVGIHLVLTCGKPLLHDVDSLTDEEGNFFRNPDQFFSNHISMSDVEREWRTQIELFLSCGLTPTHIDSHHHMHARRELRAVIEKLAQAYDLPVRKYAGMKINSFTDELNVDFFGENISHSVLDDAVSTIEDKKSLEIMVHPGYLDSVILNGSSYNVERVKEVDVLTSWDVPEHILLVKEKE